MFSIGKIVNTHGIKGEVKVQQTSDFNDRFAVGSTIYVVDKYGESTALTIDGSRTQNELLLLHFSGYDSIESVLTLKGSTLKIKEAQLTELAAHEYYYHEIIGCTVYTMEGKELGEVESILSPGANDVWVVKTKHHKEILLPYIEDVIKEIDVYKKQIYIELMEGLIE